MSFKGHVMSFRQTCYTIFDVIPKVGIVLLQAWLVTTLLIEVFGAGYSMIGEPVQITNGFRVKLKKISENGTFAPKWIGEADTLTLDAEIQSSYRLHLKIYNATNRFQVPLQINPTRLPGNSSEPLYTIQFQNDPVFSFKVVRRLTGTVLFETSSFHDFIFADQYLTLSWRPASGNVYGLGENEQKSFKHDFEKNLTWGLWSRDQPPDFTTNMYGVHPYYTVLENDGNAHSVAVVNSNAQQFAMLSGPLIQYKTTGGILDFYIFLGPTPEATVQQYTEAVGRPTLPPYWSLGFQLCRVGYSTIDRMKAAVNRTSFYGIPQDVQYGDIDIMHKNLDFTYSEENFPGLPDYVRELKEKGIKFVTIQDPFISYGENQEEYRPLKLGIKMDVWVKKSDGITPVLGRVWPEHPVYFPDYSKNATREWWKTLIKEFRDILEYDGLWIDMNEPANLVEGDVDEGCTENNLNIPPFLPKIGDMSLTTKTLCADHLQEAGRHYDVHSLYGWFQSEPTLNAVREATGKRGLVLSRSTFLGSGRWVAHWLGDNFSSWSNLHYSIIGMLQFNHFGIPFVGSDICGFIGDATPEMCQRWMQLGAFYPFARNHNGGSIEQDPGVWGPEIAESNRKVLLIRYTLLPYLYTLFYQSASVGTTVVRALWHEFPTDTNTWNIDRQFMWGSGILISPILEEGATALEAYLPVARFYNYLTGEEVPRPRKNENGGSVVTFPTPMDSINVHIRGGNVIPTQEPSVNTHISRNNPLGIIIALDNNDQATGQLFYDDGDSIGSIENEMYYLAEYTVINNTLNSTVTVDGYLEMNEKRITTIRLLGVSFDITSVMVNGNPHLNFTTLPTKEIFIENLDLNPTQNFVVVWH